MANDMAGDTGAQAAGAPPKELELTKGLGEESLEPQLVRPFDNFSYLMAWVGACVFIGYFMLGATLVPPVGKLNLFQACTCIVLAAVIVALCFTYNGQAGHKFGIPFVIQIRAACGMAGARVPILIRMVPTILWYGIQSWVGALALNGVSVKLFGFDSPVFWFISFQLLQIVLSCLGFTGIKWVENFGSIFIIFSLCVMLYVIVSDYGATIQSNVIDIPGTWGMPFWTGVTAFVGVYTTMMLNISDFTREYKRDGSNRAMTSIHLLATVPTTLFMSIIGLLSASVTGKWDPIYLFMELMTNDVMLIMALLFIAVAQITTNIMLNVIPPSFVMMDMFKFSYRKSAIITGLLTFASFPWLLVTAESFNYFILAYSIFLGPIFAVLIADYYIIRRGKFDMRALYDKDGPYKGVNWAGIIAIIVGSIFGLLWLDLSWFVSLPPSVIVYCFLLKVGPYKNSPFADTSKGVTGEEYFAEKLQKMQQTS